MSPQKLQNFIVLTQQPAVCTWHFSVSICCFCPL